MRPALAPGDRVRLVSRKQRPPRVGDVVLARHPEGLRLHRLVWGPPLTGRGAWRTKADRAVLWDPRLPSDRVLATAVTVEGRAGGLRRPGRALSSLAGAFWARLRTVLRPTPARACGR